MAWELEAMRIRKGVGRLNGAAPACAGCHRTLLPGEQLHRFETGRLLCALCLAKRPAHKPGPVSSERIRVTDRRLRVTRQATSGHTAQ
jgi:hypothetical protein